ncbi:MAG: hypothetical protein JF629_21765 [Variovorax paradoxus]|nr:hypothetical protein [Variovorax paradoxus]MBW8718377.1 hypothetical protein [Variovorax paradoxus]
MRTSVLFIPVFFFGHCPAGSRLSRQVPITEPLTVAPPLSRVSPEEARRPAYTPSPPPPPAASNAPQGPAIIPRNVGEPQRPAPESPPVYSWGPDPYYDPGRPIVRPPRPPRPQDPGPPPGQRPCQNLAGIKRNNC